MQKHMHINVGYCMPVGWIARVSVNWTHYGLLKIKFAVLLLEHGPPQQCHTISDHRIPGGTMSPSSPSVASWGVGVDDTVLHSLATTGNGRDCTTVLGGFSRGNCIPG